MSLALAVAAFVSAWTGAGWSQCKESDFPGSEGAMAAPTRPVESSSPDPVQVGVFQVELGWQHSRVTEAVRGDAFVNLIKLGVWCGAEVAWSGNSFMRSADENESTSGVGDNYLTGQYRLLYATKPTNTENLAAAKQQMEGPAGENRGVEGGSRSASTTSGPSHGENCAEAGTTPNRHCGCGLLDWRAECVVRVDPSTAKGFANPGSGGPAYATVIYTAAGRSASRKRQAHS